MRAAVTRLSAGLVWVCGARRGACEERRAAREGCSSAMRARCGLGMGTPGCAVHTTAGFWGTGANPGRDFRLLGRGALVANTLQLVATADRGVLTALRGALRGGRGRGASARACNSAA